MITSLPFQLLVIVVICLIHILFSCAQRQVVIYVQYTIRYRNSKQTLLIQKAVNPANLLSSFLEFLFLMHALYTAVSQ